MIVTPYVGVWIETVLTVRDENVATSLLMWECGLKLKTGKLIDNHHMSLLMWECGLKLKNVNEKNNVSSHSLCGSVD